MEFIETKLAGVFLIDIKKSEDLRGFFARSWCIQEFESHGLSPRFVQINISVSTKKGTLRGLHFQATPFQEEKLIRCVRGAIFDVVIDLRPGSSTYQQWLGTELTAGSYQELYVPKDFAHGFLTLEDDTEILYQVSQFYHPEAERGIRWNDPGIGILWPAPVMVISNKDAHWPDYRC